MNLKASASLSNQMAADPIRLDCAQVATPDLHTIDRLAKLQLLARRLGIELRLVNVSPPLLDLVDLCGLCEPLGLERERNAEERK